MEDLKNNRTVKIGQWVLAQGWALAQDNAVYLIKSGPFVCAFSKDAFGEISYTNTTTVYIAAPSM